MRSKINVPISPGYDILIMNKYPINMTRILLLFCCLFIAPMVIAQTADLALDVTANRPVAAPGDQIIFTLMVVNQGPSRATGVSVRDQMPSGLTYVSANTGNYSPVRRRWDIGHLEVDDTTSIQITAKLTDLGDAVYLAEVMASDQSDIDSTPDNGVDTDGDGHVMNDPDDEDDGDGQGISSAGARCFSPVEKASAMADNPSDPNGIFKFDYWVESKIKFKADGRIQSYKANYYVNTSDGSIYFPGGPGGFFAANFMRPENRSGKIESALWMPNGQMVLYAYDKENDIKRAIVRETNQTSGHVALDKALNVTQFINSSRIMIQNPDPIPIGTNISWGATEAIKGEMSDGVGTIHFALEPNIIPIPTNTHLVGFMVGIFKDDIDTRCNRLAVFTKMDVGRDYIQAELQSITPRALTVDGSDYKITTLGGDSGTNFQNTMAQFEQRMQALYTEKEDLKNRRRRCQLDLCFDRIDQQLERLQSEIEDLECEVAKAMGMEESIDGCN